MREATITSQMPDGTIIIEYENGYVFEGMTDSRHNPVCGIIKTPEGVKYDYYGSGNEPMSRIFTLIENGKLEDNRVEQ